ncbi:unnamed protein product, partial [Prorocentrum cordatum]
PAPPPRSGRGPGGRRHGDGGRALPLQRASGRRPRAGAAARHGGGRAVEARRAPSAALCCLGVLGALGACASGSAFLGGGAPRPAAAAERALQPAAGAARARRGVLAAGLAAALGGAAEEAWARDARQDSICSVKCLDICKEKLTNSTKNMKYCDYTCAKYCDGSKAEKAAKESVERGDWGARITQDARTDTFKESRLNEKKMTVVDKMFGNTFRPNASDFRDGIYEVGNKR